MEIYSEEILIACQNGKPCSYGICDECPNILGTSGNNKSEVGTRTTIYESEEDHNIVIPTANVPIK